MTTDTPSSPAEFALQAMVAAGHVSQELVDKAMTLPGAPLSARAGETLSVALRPEALRLGRLPDAEALLTAKVTDVHFMGSVIRLKADLAGTAVSLDTFNRPDTPPPVVGSTVEVSLSGRDFIQLQA